MKKIHSTPGWCAALLLTLLLTMAGTQAASASSDEASPTTTAGATESTAENRPAKTRDGEPYVVHDQVFVEEDAPEIPGSSTIAAKLPLALDETPIAIDTVLAEDIERQNATVLGDALGGVAGINVQSGNGIFDVFTLRGLDTTANGLILTDGAPEPQSAYYQLYNVERVEVLKGPGSFLYGGFSMGGAINLVRKQPTRGDFTRIGLEGGSFSTFQGTLDTNHFGERWGVRLNLQAYESDLHRDRLRAETFAVNPAFTFLAGDKTTVNVNLEYIETDAVPDAGIPLVATIEGLALPGIDPDTSFNDPASRSDQEVARFQVDVEHRFGDNLVLRNKTFVRDFDWLSDSTILSGTFPLVNPIDLSIIGQAVARNQLMLDDAQTFTGNQLEALWRVRTGTVEHHLLFGLELARFEDEFVFDVASLDPLDLFGGPLGGGFEFLLQRQGNDAESTVVAPYVVDQIRFSDRFQLLLGLRFDDIDFEERSFQSFPNPFDGSLVTFRNEIDRSASEVSPMLGAVVALSERASIYFNAAEAFSPPSTFTIGEVREPEEGEQFELGLRIASPDGRLAASIAGFRIDRDHIAIPDQTGITRQNGSQRSEGFELELSARLAPGLDLALAYTATDAVLTDFTEFVFNFDPLTGEVFPTFVDRAGNAVPWAPDNLFSLRLAKRFDRWGLGGGGRWIDEQFIAADNDFAVDDHFLVDAVVWFEAGSWGRVQVNLENITDEETFTRVFNSTSVLPAPGFAATVGLKLDL